jgi:hypothetical protein
MLSLLLKTGKIKGKKSYKNIEILKEKKIQEKGSFFPILSAFFFLYVPVLSLHSAVFSL